MVTLKKLSEMTGFSIATISRVLNNDKNLKTTQETRDLIKSIAKEAGYKTLQTKKKERRAKEKSEIKAKVGLLTSVDTENATDPYYIYLKGFVEEICFKEKAEIITMRYNKKKDKYILLPKKKLDGIIVIGHFSRREIEILPTLTKNIVFLDCAPDDLIYSSVAPNLEMGVRIGVDFLKERGHENICFAGPRTAPNFYNEEKVESRRKAFFEHTQEHSFMECERFMEDAKSKTMKYIEENELPDAFFAVNESVAVGILNGLQSRNIKVPEQVSVLSYNNTVFSKFVDPKLTSVSIDSKNMATLAMNLLLKQVKKKKYSPIEIKTFPTIAIGGSVR